MSTTIHVASHEIPYLQECLRLGILAVNARPVDDDDWEADAIEEIGIRVMQDLADGNSSGDGYVAIPEPTHPRRGLDA